MSSRPSLSMRLDRFARAAARKSPRARTLAPLSRIALLSTARRGIIALVIGALVAWMVYDRLVNKGQRLGDLFGGGGHEAATDVQATVILAGAAGLVALLLLVSGLRRWRHAIAVIEHGVPATATVRGVEMQTYWRHQSIHHRWVARCRFAADSGQKGTVEVMIPTEDSLAKGDQLAVLYDPDLPEHAVAVAALPRYVKTTPPLEGR